MRRQTDGRTSVCLYVCPSVCLYVCMKVGMYECRYVGMFAYAHACIHVCLYVYAYVCMHAYMQACKYARMYHQVMTRGQAEDLANQTGSALMSRDAAGADANTLPRRGSAAPMPGPPRPGSSLPMGPSLYASQDPYNTLPHPGSALPSARGVAPEDPLGIYSDFDRQVIVHIE